MAKIKTYYVYAGYYENFISGHKLPKPYTLRAEFKTFDDAVNFVWKNWEDDGIFFTEDVIDDGIKSGLIDDENWESFLMKESNKKARKSIKEKKIKPHYDKDNHFMFEVIPFFPTGLEGAKRLAKEVSKAFESYGVGYENSLYPKISLHEDGIIVYCNSYYKDFDYENLVKSLSNFGIVIDMDTNKPYFESKKSARKSLKEYRTVGFEQLVRDTIVEILEDPHYDLFDYDDEIITYENEGRARITSNGDVDMDFITLPTYFFSSGRSPRNKKLAKLIDDIVETNFEYARERLWDRNKNELIELGILSKDDDKLNYNDLYDMGASGLAEELSEYEMDLEGTDLYTDVYCELEETDEGIELTVSMTVQDAYGSVLVRDYKPNTVSLSDDMSEKDLTNEIEKAIKKVTEQF